MAAKGYSVEYRNVKADKALLDEMLAYSGGSREVPVIVQNGKLVDIGWGGFT